MSAKSSTSTRDSAAEVKPGSLPAAGDMETLRDILFGNQARATETRLDNLEHRLDRVQRELSETIDGEVKEARDHAAAQLSSTRSVLVEQMDKLNAGQTNDLKALQKELSSAIEQLGKDIDKRLNELQSQLASRIDRSNADLSQRLLTAQEESRARDDDLRKELLTLTAWLDDKKTNRQQLAEMLHEVAGRLQQDGKAPADESD